jgi:hypothetical protein
MMNNLSSVVGGTDKVKKAAQKLQTFLKDKTPNGKRFTAMVKYSGKEIYTERRTRN